MLKGLPLPFRDWKLLRLCKKPFWQPTVFVSPTQAGFVGVDRDREIPLDLNGCQCDLVSQRIRFLKKE